MTRKHTTPPASFYTDDHVYGPAAREKVARRFWKKVNKNGVTVRTDLGPCWEWLAYREPLGYGRFRIGTATTGGRAYYSHRVAWFLTHEQWPSENCLHECDNPCCVNPSHLSDGSQTQNLLDMTLRGRRKPIPVKRGSQCHNAKLTEESVRIIRASHNLNCEAAACFGVSPDLIGRIRAGKLWRHVA